MKSWKNFIPTDDELSRLVKTLKEYFTQLDKHGLIQTNPGKGTESQILTSNGPSGNPTWQSLNLPVNSSPFIVGEIVTSLLSEAQYQGSAGTGWILMDGRDVTGSAYHTLTGNTVVPDVTTAGRFLRSTGGAAASLGSVQADTTAVNGLANAASTATVNKNQLNSNQNSHNHGANTGYYNPNHRHSDTVYYDSTGGPVNAGYVNSFARGTVNAHTTYTNYTSINHRHSISSNTISWASANASGTAAAQTITGDTETRPTNLSVNYFIRIN